MKRTLDKVVALAGSLGLIAAAYPVAAHHSTAMFEVEKLLPIVGTVKEVHWTNPHVAIVVENTAAQLAAPGLWVIELPSPGNLVRSGWTRTAVKPGDKVRAEIHPLRNATHGGALRKITLSDTGQSYSYNIRDSEQPNLAQGYSK
jgi:hypothetical protein